MIILKNITLRNFLSIGQVTQAVELDKQELTLILGENLDLGGDGARNGTGKTTLIQGLSYALFGIAINSIRKDNLVNRTNAKAMMVTLEFSVNGIDYKIERGRKPNILRFYANNQQQKTVDDAQGENKETQAQIEKIINMTSDMFNHIVALNTYSEPFLAMKANDQRNIIEQLLGITLLSEKAEIIKTMIKTTKDDIQAEDFKIKGIEEANKRVATQIESMKRRHNLWVTNHENTLAYLVKEHDELAKIDIEAELLAHNRLTVYNQKKAKQDAYNSVLARQIAWNQKRDKDLVELNTTYLSLNSIDIEQELQAHKDLVTWNQLENSIATVQATVDRNASDLKKESKSVDKLKAEVETLEEHKCHTCGQDFHDDKHKQVLDEKLALLTNAVDELLLFQNSLAENKKVLEGYTSQLTSKPTTYYKTETEAIKHSSQLENISKSISDKTSELNPYDEQLSEQENVDPGQIPTTIYDNETQAIKHSSQLINLMEQITKKYAETSPHLADIQEMESTAIQQINFDTINKLTKVMEHQKFLLDILTNKDSFVRKKIVDQNLSYLNSRLTHYLDKIGLPHQVVFRNDMTVEITELGRELDFGNLSRGEANRLILGLSFAFRDVWENLYQPINTLFIDELIDSGLDTMGVENSVAILKDMSRRRQKSIWLVSHREELAGRVPNILKVVKEGGFTSYSTAVDIQ
jgi:DNA repair exonuclease SbcCD ATPase subunit